jgi:protein disulfide-isomerase
MSTAPEAAAELTPDVPPPTKIKPPVISAPPANTDGVSVPLNFQSFSKQIAPLTSRSIGTGWFVKFYVPWCSHCQAMAPAWTELAREMKGKLHIGEVNCEVEIKLCSDIKLRGYPTLIFFKGGERVEYDGLRGVGDLVSFANKAVQYPLCKCH